MWKKFPILKIKFVFNELIAKFNKIIILKKEVVEIEYQYRLDST